MSKILTPNQSPRERVNNTPVFVIARRSQPTKQSKFLKTAAILFFAGFLVFPNFVSATWTCGQTLTDTRDNKTYATVSIGTQCWMAQNLNVGTKITSCVEGSLSGEDDTCSDFGYTLQNQGTSCASIQKYCYLDNEANCTTNGGLYQWNQAMCGSTTEGATGICPTGWHVPTDAEQYTLENYLKDAGQTCDAARSGYDCDTAGTKLETGGSSGFNSIFTGDRLGGTSGAFSNRTYDTYFWSSLQSGTSAMIRQLYYGNTTVSRNATTKTRGYPVRCILNTNSARARADADQARAY